MKRFALLVTMFVAMAAVVGCNDDNNEDFDINELDIMGVWQNLSDENDVFTFKYDKSGSYDYRYIDSTDATTGVITYFPTSGSSSYLFDYYTLEYNGENYDLTFFGSPFPITNAKVDFVDDYLRIKYDWSDYRGKEWFDVIELYKRVY